MATDVQITAPNISIYVAVPPARREGVCRVCHGATNAREYGGYWPTCWNCRAVPANGVRNVVPVSLVHTSESQLYASLREYKSESPYISATTRAEHRLLLAATVQRFLRIHRPHIAAAAGDIDWDGIQVVPSTRPGRAEHPLEAVVRRTVFRDDLAQLLTPTGQTISRTPTNPAAFAPTEDADGRRVLIIDDTFTTGSHVQSAAIALRNAGATVVAAVPIGRVIDTDREEKAAFWRRQRAVAFDFDTCCLE